MSVDISSVPPWKRELLDRKRRQEEDDRRKREEEIKQMSQMPTWKRDIIQKKNKGKSIVYMSNSSSNTKDSSPERVTKDTQRRLRRSSSSSETDKGDIQMLPESRSEFDSMSEPSSGENHQDAVQEHIIPIQQNPWLRSDLEKRHSHSRTALRATENDVVLSDAQDTCQPISVSIPNHTSCMDTDGRVPALHSPNTNNNDDVFGEEEVTYGRGFVHKLLRRFKHLSSREERNAHPLKPTSPKRTHSSDNILEDNRKSGKMSPRGYFSPDSSLDKLSSLSQQRAHSMESLSTRTKLSTSSISSSEYTANTSNPISSTSSSDNICESDSGIGNNGGSSANTPAQEGSNITPVNNLSIKEKPEEKSDNLRRSNIVSVARSVFESISTRPAPPPRKKHAASYETVTSKSVSMKDSLSSTENSDFDATDKKETSVNVEEKPAEQVILLKDDNHLQSEFKGKTENVESTKSEVIVSKTASASSQYFYGQSRSSPSSMIYPATTRAKSSDTDSRRNVTAGHDINANKSKDVNRVSYGSKADAPLVGTEAEKTHASVNSSAKQPPSSSSSVFADAEEFIKTGSSKFSNTSVGVKINGVKTDEKPASKSTKENILIIDAKREKPLPNEKLYKKAVSDQKVTSSQKDKFSVQDTVKETFDDKDRVSTNQQTITQGDHHDHRNPEANRLNLNLNLNELHPKKTIVESTNIDINRNNALNVPSNAQSSSASTKNSGKSTSENKTTNKKRVDRSSGPGSLLIRPASNLVVGSITDVKYLNLTKYNDVKVGEFEPAKKRPGYYDEDFEEYVPVTNIDDVLSEDVPITNIDDMPTSPREGDASIVKVRRKKYEFEGAGVIIANKSNLARKPGKGMSISFNDSAISTYEYPSEQFLLDTMPSTPGDFDYPVPPSASDNTSAQQNGTLEDEEEVPDFLDAGLKSTPGVGTGGALSGYKTKTQVDYYFGMEVEKKEEERQVKEPEPQMTEEVQAKPADEDFTWSDSTTSDMLF